MGVGVNIVLGTADMPGQDRPVFGRDGPQRQVHSGCEEDFDEMSGIAVNMVVTARIEVAGL